MQFKYVIFEGDKRVTNEGGGERHEVAFLFPWAISLGDIGVFGFWSMMAFLGVLTVGFCYEWKKGALEWE